MQQLGLAVGCAVAMAMVGCGSSGDGAAPDAGADATVAPEGGGQDGGGSNDGGVVSPGDGSAGVDGGGDACAPLGGKVVRARDHLDAWGVNFAPAASGADVAADKLEQIGVRRIRAHLALGKLADWQALAQAMVTKKYLKPQLAFDDLVIAYNNTAVSWSDQKAGILAAAATGLLTSLEGPNEMNNVGVGGGSHGVDDPTDQTANWAGANGNVFRWASAISTWKASLAGGDAAAMAKVEIYAPTIASGLESDYAMLPKLDALVDFGTLHYYAGAPYQPSLSQGQDNPGVGYFANLLGWCRAGMTPQKPMVVSECGATTPPGGGYSPRAQAAYLLNQLHEAAGAGVRRVYFYTLFDPSTGTGGDEGNFGLFHTDGSDKPITVALAAVKHLFSLKNDFDDPANATDTACFQPGYDGAGLTVSGIGAAGFSSRVADAVVYAKSDGTTVISITNEPPVTDGNGNDVTPAAVTATVRFGSAQSWHLYDPFDATPRTAVSSGSGASVDVPLVGYPKYLILDAPPGYRP